MKIAVIGTGISGMVTAYLLCGDHDITVFEANDYIGGHTHTHDIRLNGERHAVDSGFIVFNELTYPNFVALMRRLEVAWQPSSMGFSVRCEKTGLEYRPRTLDTLFAQRRNLFRPFFYRMILDIFRFQKKSGRLLASSDDQISLEAYLKQEGYSRGFVEYFIMPMGASIWSADPEKFRSFPARYFVEFFMNHGFLRLRNQPQWLVIQGGSRKYVERLTAPYAQKIRLNCPVESLKRETNRVLLKPRGGEAETFDSVIVATHSDQALRMLSDPTDRETEILYALPYQENLAVLHTDTSLLPRHRKCWASWNYHIPLETLNRVAVTYDMNILQSIESREEFCVTLNREEAISPEKILKRMHYAHPVFTPEGRKAQQRKAEISGQNRTFYCGAYWGYGFHEDGVKSALEVCRHFGKTL